VLFHFENGQVFLPHPVYKMQHLESSGTSVLYIGRTVFKV